MDEELSKLERELEANPSDPKAARALENALRRAGRDDEIRRLYAFKFQCDVDWRELPSKHPGSFERHCDRCERSVHFVRTQDELASRVQAGDCVAFDPANLDALAFLVEDSSAHPAQDPSRPCLVEGEEPIPIPPLAGMPAQLKPSGPPELKPPPMAGGVKRIRRVEPDS